MNPEVMYCIRITVATLCGMLLGAERNKHYKSAGVRVYSLISLTSSLLMVLSKYAFADLTSADGFLFGTDGTDPARMAAGVIGGISFICLAIIYRKGNTLLGLTTSAGLIATVGVGLAIGSGMYIVGLCSTFLIWIIQSVSHKMNLDNDSMASRDITIRIVNDMELRSRLMEDISALGTELSGSSITHHPDGTISCSYVMKLNRKIDFEDLLAITEPYPGKVFDLSID